MTSFNVGPVQQQDSSIHEIEKSTDGSHREGPVARKSNSKVRPSPPGRRLDNQKVTVDRYNREAKRVPERRFGNLYVCGLVVVVHSIAQMTAIVNRFQPALLDVPTIPARKMETLRSQKHTSTYSSTDQIPIARPTTSPTATPKSAPTSAPTSKPTLRPNASPTAPPTATPTASLADKTSTGNSIAATSPPPPPLRLRYDWTDLEPKSEIARQIAQHQSNCSLPLGNFNFRNLFGLGSDLHLWGQALCNAMEYKLRIRTVQPWIFWDEDECNNVEANKILPLATGEDSEVTISGNASWGGTYTAKLRSKSLLASSMSCYFPKTELLCPGDTELAVAHPEYGDQIRTIADGYPFYDCRSIMDHENDQSLSTFRAGAMEYMFSSVSPVIIREAERQLSLVFGHNGRIPKDLVTVHIRWGDKKAEMELVPIQDYVDAIYKLLNQRFPGRNPDDSANIFLATEDPNAVEQFKALIPSSWNVYIDQYYVEMLPHRIDQYNGNPQASKALQGKPGLFALGSLLVAMEANDYVLTTASNWSRVLNELRKSIVDSRCGGCTQMIDLRFGQW